MDCKFQTAHKGTWCIYGNPSDNDMLKFYNYNWKAVAVFAGMYNKTATTATTM